MSEDLKAEVVKARDVLGKRYDWEVKALAQDIVNKIEMEILNDPTSIRSYISNLLQSHPRVKDVGRSAETLMVSKWREAGEDRGDIKEWLEAIDGNYHELQMMAYIAMGTDLYEILHTHGVSLGGTEE